MDYLKAYKQLESDKIFAKWRKENPDDYLTHFFAQFGADFKVIQWQIGYYDQKKDMITTFDVGNRVELKGKEEVFKKQDSIKMLDLGDVKVDYECALEKARQFQMKKYQTQIPLRGLVILQNLAHVVWNFTFITQAFSALNIKVNTVDGTVNSYDLSSFFDMKSEYNGGTK